MLYHPVRAPTVVFWFALGCGAGDPGGSSLAASLDPIGSPASEPSLSDEFDDPASLSQWRIWHAIKGVPATHDLLDIATTNSGMLTLRPKAGGWFDNFEAPLVYKMVSGNFMAEIQVDAGLDDGADGPPTEQFNSAGLMVRDPTHGVGNANWVMFNTGRQLGDQVASEGKTTVDSQSTLTLIDGPHRGLLRMCRVGTNIILARRLDGEAEFRVVHRFDRPDLPRDLQVGLVTGGWNTSAQAPDTSRDPDIEARFDYIRFSLVQNEAQCVAP